MRREDGKILSVKRKGTEKKKIPQTYVMSATARAKYRRKMEEMNLSRNNLAKFLGVTEGTLCKWEDGKTDHGSVLLRQKMRDFLDGNYDCWFNGQEDNENDGKYSENVSDAMKMCMEKISDAYLCCAASPHVRKHFINILDAAAMSSMQSLVTGSCKL